MKHESVAPNTGMFESLPIPGSYRGDNAEERVRIMLDAAPVSAILYDKNKRIMDYNIAALKIFGLTGRGDLEDGFGYRLMPPFQPNNRSSRIFWDEHFENAQNHGFSRDTLICQKLDGTIVHTEATWASVGYKGENAVIEYLIDQTEKIAAISAERESNNKQRDLEFQLREQVIKQKEQRRIEVAEESSRAKSRFLARMSHEIRTPIASVLGISEIQLQSTNLPTIVEESFAKIHDSAGILLNIVNDILDLSKIEAGKMNLLSEEYEISGLISEAVQPHLINLGRKELEFLVQVDPTLPRSLIGDISRIKQIINNLLSNAFKYTENGTVEIHIRHLKTDKIPFITLEFCICDTGFGMSNEQIEVLQSSDEYTRFHEHESHVTGTGLGMPIVYNLVEIMGGTISIESEVGKGTSVTVCIPQQVGNAIPVGAEMALRLQAFEFSRNSARKKFSFTPEPMPYGRVLVVDDVDANLYVAQGLLSFYGLKIETCTSGYAALEFIRHGEKYDLIFMDQMMPGIDGVETMQQLRSMGYDGSIVALTANALIGQAEELINMGFDGFISKPIQTVHLNAVLTRHIRDKYSKDERDAAIANNKQIKMDNINGFQNDPVLMRKLRCDFVKRHKNTISEISKALVCNDWPTAHVLVHTIKGSAGLIEEHELAQSALLVEAALAKNKQPESRDVTALEASLTAVLERLGTTDELYGGKSRQSVLALFDKLEPLLEAKLADSHQFLDELCAIPEASIIVRQIEEYDFVLALKNLRTLRGII